MAGNDFNAAADVAAIKKMSTAIFEGDLATVREMVLLGFDVNARSESGTTPLMRAANTGQEDIARFLLSKGADVDAEKDYGETALTLAAREGYADVMAALIENGANIEMRGESGCTVLMEAVCSDSLDAVRCMIDAGADPLKKDDHASTAEDIARAGCCDEIVDLLEKATRRAVLSHDVMAVQKTLGRRAVRLQPRMGGA